MTAVALSPTMPWIATGSMDKTVNVWRIERDGVSRTGKYLTVELFRLAPTNEQSLLFIKKQLLAAVQSPEAIWRAKASQKSVLGDIQQEKLPLHVYCCLAAVSRGGIVIDVYWCGRANYH